MAGIATGQDEKTEMTKILQNLLNIPSTNIPTTSGSTTPSAPLLLLGRGAKPSQSKPSRKIEQMHQQRARYAGPLRSSTNQLRMTSSTELSNPVNKEHQNSDNNRGQQKPPLNASGDVTEVAVDPTLQSYANFAMNSEFRLEPIDLNSEADFAATKLFEEFSITNGMVSVFNKERPGDGGPPTQTLRVMVPSRAYVRTTSEPLPPYRLVLKAYKALDNWLMKPSVSDDVRRAHPFLKKVIELEINSPNLAPEEEEMFAAVILLFDAFHIKKLPMRVPKFPKAKYWCDLCNYHLDTLVNAVSHMTDERHVKAEVHGQESSMVEKFIDISMGHRIAVTNSVLKIVISHGMSYEDQLVRLELYDRINQLLGGLDYEHELQLFGSSTSGFGFKESNINLNLVVPAQLERTPGSFNSVVQILKAMSYAQNVQEDRSSLWSIVYEDTIAEKQVNIQLNNSVGVNCARLFAEYDKLDNRIRPLVTAFRYWAKMTFCADPEGGTLPGFVFSIMVIHYLQEIRVIPILHNSPGTSTTGESATFRTAEEALKTWEKNDHECIGSLWVGLLKYYANFATHDRVVSISQNGPSRKSDKAWNRKLSVEDPILPKTNLSRCLSSNKVCDYIFDRIRAAYIYFATPRTIDGPLFEGIISASNVKPMDKVYYYKITEEKPNPLQDVLRQMQMSRTKVKGDIPNDVAPFSTKRSTITSKPISVLKSSTSNTDSNSLQNSSNNAKVSARLVNMLDSNGKKRVYVIQEDLHLLSDVLEDKQYFYEFDKSKLQGSERPPKYCKACSYDGHLKKDCPEETIPRMRLVPVEPTPFTLRILSRVMQRNYELEALNDNDVRIRRRITEDIHSALSQAFSDLDLTMFGSTYNGFGLHMSDVDICMRLKNVQLSKADMQTEEVNGILKTVVRQLKAAGCMQEILAIPSAKVPIVKFRHRMSRLEGDISLSNVLALHNTRMLRMYAEIDDRLKVLGCFLKKVTKLCDISDASKGSLSSYGYVLMLIHFLQQHNPPVLPVLQELPVGPNPPLLVEGCNAYFFADIQNLGTVWPQYGKNKESAGELWTAFLQYYAERFKFDEHVITINQFEPLSRFSKFWLSETVIAIEDPFERSHNLGAGLSRRMGVHIVKAFQRFREIFSVPIDNLGNLDWLIWFLDPRRIRGNSNPPVDRQCRICNRIGHFAKNCTFFSTGDDSSYSYKDEEAPTHQSRNRNYGHKDEDSQNRNRTMGNMTNRQSLPSKPGYQNRPIENQSRAGSTMIERRPLGPPQKVGQSREQFGKSGPNRPDTNNRSQRHSMDTGRTERFDPNGSNVKSQHMQSGHSVNAKSNAPSNFPTHQQNSFRQSPDIHFFGVGNQDSDKVIEAMISRNPGVVFQLRDREIGSETLHKVGPLSESPLLNIGPITPPTEYRSGNRSPVNIRKPSTFSPPPGFLKHANTSVKETGLTETKIEQGFSFFDSPVPQINSLGGFSTGNSSSLDGGSSSNGSSIPRHCAPPPGFSSLPTAPPFPTHPPQLGISNNFQVAGNMYQQLTAPIHLSAAPFPTDQNRINPVADRQFSSGVPPPGPDPSTTMYDQILTSIHQQVTSEIINGVEQCPTPYYTHGAQLQQHAQMNELYQRNGMTSGGNVLSPYNISVMMPTQMNLPMNNTKSPMMVMRPGDPPNQSTNNDILGTSSHSCLLSHIHHGPVVSAVPVQTGYTLPHLVPMPQHHPQQFQYGGYPYPFQYPQQIYHPQMMHHGFGHPQQYPQTQLEDPAVISEAQCQGQGTVPSTPYQLNSLENKEN